MSRVIKTSKGTELTLRLLQGKEYLDVQYRVLWMRDDKPDWSIETTFLALSPQECIAQATVKDGSGKVIAQGTKRETPQTFARGFIEKAETGAVGRALGFSGFGTQFAQDLDEPDADGNENPTIVDAPQSPKSGPAPLKAVPNNSEPGAYVIQCNPFKGKRLDEIDIYQLNSWVKKWEGKEITGVLLDAITHAEPFLKSREIPRAK